MTTGPDSIDSDQILRLVLDSIPIRVFWKNLDLEYLGANQAFADDAGEPNVRSLLGKSDYDMCWCDQAENFRNDDWEVIKSGQAKLNIEEQQDQADGTRSWLLTNKVPLKDDKGQVIGILGTYDDITDRVRYREKIEGLASRDPLTGLLNRRGLHDIIAMFNGKAASLIFIDLDHFKEVNDSLGHSIGDELLQLVAQRVQASVSLKGVVTRLGGDEFSIFVPLGDDPYPIKQACVEDIVRGIFSAILEPFSIQSHIINLGVSAGVTFISCSHQKNNSHAADAFREADMAMYSAKEQGRNTYRFYDAVMQEKMTRKHELQNELNQAINNHELHLLFQPQVNTQGELVGAEALLRWDNLRLGAVSPVEFISIAEQSGLIHSIGYWVLDNALKTLNSWSAIISKIPTFRLAINVSSRQFHDVNFSERVKELIADNNVNPKHVQLEITESLFIEDEKLVFSAMRELKDIGVSFAIDDFGVGYSCLSSLVNLPIDKLKIDKSFVDQLEGEVKNKKLVGTIVSMAQNLGMEVIAEGVERVEQKDILVKLGCTQFQGYFFSYPITDSELLSKYS